MWRQFSQWTVDWVNTYSDVRSNCGALSRPPLWTCCTVGVGVWCTVSPGHQTDTTLVQSVSCNLWLGLHHTLLCKYLVTPDHGTLIQNQNQLLWKRETNHGETIWNGFQQSIFPAMTESWGKIQSYYIKLIATLITWSELITWQNLLSQSESQWQK